jgi:hypothetical protein
MSGAAACQKSAARFDESLDRAARAVLEDQKDEPVSAEETEELDHIPMGKLTQRANLSLEGLVG